MKKSELFVGLRRSHRQQIKSKINSVHARRIFNRIFFFPFHALNAVATIFTGLSSGRFVWDSLIIHSCRCTVSLVNIKITIASFPFLWFWTKSTTMKMMMMIRRWQPQHQQLLFVLTYAHNEIHTIHEDIGTHEMLKIAQVICSICVCGFFFFFSFGAQSKKIA